MNSWTRLQKNQQNIKTKITKILTERLVAVVVALLANKDFLRRSKSNAALQPSVEQVKQ